MSIISTNLRYRLVRCTATDYATELIPDENAIYFLTDTGRIYVGSQLYNGGVLFVDQGVFPDSGNSGVLYIDPASGLARVFANGNWVDIAGENSVQSLQWNEDDKALTVSSKNGTETISLTGLVEQIAYDSTSGIFTVSTVGGKVTEFATPTERFLSAAEYDPEQFSLKLTLNSGVVFSIPLTDLVQLFSAGRHIVVDQGVIGLDTLVPEDIDGLAPLVSWQNLE